VHVVDAAGEITPPSVACPEPLPPPFASCVLMPPKPPPPAPTLNFPLASIVIVLPATS
jgi:hypothetical protein